ncbi:hypothetical protein DAETH_45150 (plasmid) [Deinococcus aetherius]|uniref:LysM domain-containing protein n=1 Tax=Deinococcus aetherius TaxID=200252 RepID=A0ABN6RRM4_9DEIO|nr:peptidoglycan DD-metalloendopeptidase family protein [Deinococcus aetherius]BDP44546.1 hypothetical protein DAETH_45150 [Deinococcus aetherius]
MRPLSTLLLACTSLAAAVNVTVLPGDTVPRLAARYGVSPLDLLLANPGLQPSDLRAGLSVTLPPGAVGLPVPVPSPVAAPPPAVPAGEPVVSGGPVAPAGTTTWTVRRGDTLSAVARQHGLTLAGLLALNPQVDPGRLLMVGRVLVVPVGSTPAAGVAPEATPSLPSPLAASPATPPTSGVPGATSSASPAQVVSVVPPSPQEPVSPGSTPAFPVPPTPVVPAPGTEAAPRQELPVSGARLTSSFSPVHQGIDLAVPQGTPIYAVAAGVVVESYFDARSGWGWTVLLQHEGGLRTRYSHNSANVAQVGEQVQAGQLIARVGSTGHSTGPHVDYRVYAAGGAIDPLAPAPVPSAVRGCPATQLLPSPQLSPSSAWSPFP